MHLSKWIIAHLVCNATNDDKLKVLNNNSNGRLTTYFCFINSYQNKHGNILINLNSQKSLKNN